MKFKEFFPVVSKKLNKTHRIRSPSHIEFNSIFLTNFLTTSFPRNYSALCINKSEVISLILCIHSELHKHYDNPPPALKVRIVVRSTKQTKIAQNC